MTKLKQVTTLFLKVLQSKSGLLFGVPIPEEFSADGVKIETEIQVTILVTILMTILVKIDLMYILHMCL